MSNIRHSPLEPSWTCAACGEAWPCPDRRASFLADFEGRRVELRAVLSLFLIDATEDLPDPITDLHKRFVGWSYSGG